MARTTTIRNNLNGGEISPELLGRTDLERYYSSCETMANFITMLQGGAVRRSGSRLVTDAMGPSRLIPFIFSAAQAYVLEFGNQTLRFYTNGGQIQAAGGGPYQIATPYNTGVDDLWDLKSAQQADVMYLVHPNHPPMKLSRLADNDWLLTQPSFYPPPSHAFDQDVGAGTISLTPGATSGTGISFGASAPVFIQADVGKAIVAGAGLAFITALGGSIATDPNTGATLYAQATADIVDSFASPAPLPAGQWLLRGAPQSYASYGAILNGAWYASGKLGLGGIQQLYGFSAFPIWSMSTSGMPSQDTFRQVDVGRYVILGGSVGQITGLVSAKVANVRLFSPITITQAITETSTTASANVVAAMPVSGGAWSLEDFAFGTSSGYPRAVCFFQDRLWLGGTQAQPQTIWGSVTDDYENFAKGAEDDDSLDLTIASGDFELIQWLNPFQGQLVCGTYCSEYIIGGGGSFGGNGVAVTPSNVSSQQQSRYGSARVQPLVVDSDLIYLHRALQACHRFSWDIQLSVYTSRNLNLFASTITTAGFKEMTYAQVPYRTLFFTTLDDQLLGFTYQRENEVWGWHRHPTGQADATIDDSVVSVTVIPDPSGLTDQIWLCCSRTLAGGALTYTIEVIGEPADSDLFVDCASHQVFTTPVSAVSGLAYLAGRTVYAVADGAVYGPLVMSTAGTMTFQIAASDVQVGLPYESTLLTTRPEFPGAPTIQGLLKRWNRAWVRLYSSVGLSINGIAVPFRSAAMAMDEGVPEQTVDVVVQNLGYDRDGRVLVVQEQPLPCTVLAVFGQFGVGEN